MAVEDKLILVNEQDVQTGSCGKMEAHERGLLHRAFSIFIFRRALVDNPDGTRNFHNQLLIQKRAAGKYHSAGLWANSCCSHPRDGESLEEATMRRLLQETGISTADLMCGEAAGPENALEEKGAFIYRADFDNGLTEYEFDHVFVGWLPQTGPGSEDEAAFAPDSEEAEEMKFVDVEWVMHDVLLNPSAYAAWFMPALLIATDGTDFESLHKEASDRMIY